MQLQFQLPPTALAWPTIPTLLGRLSWRRTKVLRVWCRQRRYNPIVFSSSKKTNQRKLRRGTTFWWFVSMVIAHIGIAHRQHVLNRRVQTPAMTLGGYRPPPHRPRRGEGGSGRAPLISLLSRFLFWNLKRVWVTHPIPTFKSTAFFSSPPC